MIRNAVLVSPSDDKLIFFQITSCSRFLSSDDSLGNLTANESVEIQETMTSVMRMGACPSSRSSCRVRRLPRELWATPKILQPALERSFKTPSPETIRAPSSPE